jgi:hypothetical protein
MAIDIPSLFRDVIETPEQRQRRKLSEAVALAPQARGGIASLLNPLAQAASINLQQGSEGLGRSVGGMLGLDMRDTSEKVSDELLGADLSNPQGIKNLSMQLQDIAPLQSIGLMQAATEQEKEQKELDRQIARQNAADARARAAEQRSIAAAARAEENLEMARQREARAGASWIQGMINSAADREKEVLDRQNLQIAAQAVKETLPSDSPYSAILDLPNVSETTIRAAAGSKEGPPIQIRNIMLDGKEYVAGLEPDTGNILWQLDHPDQKATIPNLSATMQEAIIEDIKKDPVLSEMSTKRFMRGPALIGEGPLADLIHNTQHKAGVNRQQAINIIKETYQSENGRVKIENGFVDLGEYKGETGDSNEDSVFEEADAVIKGENIQQETDENFRFYDVPGNQLSEVSETPPPEQKGIDEQVESIIAYNERMNASPKTTENAINNVINTRKKELEKLEKLLTSAERGQAKLKFGNEDRIADLKSQIDVLKETINYYSNPSKLIASR